MKSLTPIQRPWRWAERLHEPRSTVDAAQLDEGAVVIWQDANLHAVGVNHPVGCKVADPCGA